MGVIAWIVPGAVAGLIAEHLTGKRTGLLLATVIGIVGALLGGFIANAVVRGTDAEHVLQPEHMDHRDHRCRCALPSVRGRPGRNPASSRVTATVTTLRLLLWAARRRNRAHRRCWAAHERATSSRRGTPTKIAFLLVSNPRCDRTGRQSDTDHNGRLLPVGPSTQPFAGTP